MGRGRLAAAVACPEEKSSGGNGTDQPTGVGEVLQTSSAMRWRALRPRGRHDRRRGSAIYGAAAPLGPGETIIPRFSPTRGLLVS